MLHEGSTNIVIRPLESPKDFEAFERLQREIWGMELQEVITGSHAKIAQRIGGIAAGAFDAHDELLGMVFGFTGYKNGHPMHWSHMLAVRFEARNLGLGRNLKVYQRETLLRSGIRDVFWTYDPLVAKNAHLNFNLLGVEAEDYVEDMYGQGEDSELFRGLGTDRFIVRWRIDTEKVRSALESKWTFERDPFIAEQLSVSRLNESDKFSDPVMRDCSQSQRFRIEIPSDIHALRDHSVEVALRWREATRAAFQLAYANNFQVAGFYRDATTDRCFYCLGKKR